jgi:hypothetical protein
MYHTILVPLGGSAFGEQALPFALAIARSVNGHIHLDDHEGEAGPPITTNNTPPNRSITIVPTRPPTSPPIIPLVRECAQAAPCVYQRAALLASRSCPHLCVWFGDLCL